MAMKCLVAGGAGFIGSHVCERLVADGHEVVALDNFVTGFRRNLATVLDAPNFRLVEHDVCDPYPQLGVDFDRIYNFACPASPPHYQRDPVFTLRTNFLGVLHGLELAERAGARFLQASTSEVYGDPDVHPQPEAYRGSVSCTGPRACYDEGKRVGEALCMDFRRSRGVDARLPRIFNTYGPRMDPGDGRVVSNFIVQALRGEPITVYGDGTQSRSFCYVDDLVGGLVLLMEHPTEQGPVNLGNQEELTMVELARSVLDLVGGESQLVYKPLPTDDPKMRRPDLARARTVLGYAPSTPLKDGIDRTLSWFRDHLSM